MIGWITRIKRSLIDQVSTRIFKYQIVVISMGNQGLDYTKNSDQQPYRKGESFSDRRSEKKKNWETILGSYFFHLYQK